MATALLLLPLLHHTYCLCCTTPTAIAALLLQVHPVTIMALNVPETSPQRRNAFLLSPGVSEFRFPL